MWNAAMSRAPGTMIEAKLASLMVEVRVAASMARISLSLFRAPWP
jgi:hypothetical protein